MRKTKVPLINNCEYCIFPEGVGDIKEFIEHISLNGECCEYEKK